MAIAAWATTLGSFCAGQGVEVPENRTSEDRSALMVYDVEAKASRVGRAEGWHLAGPSWSPDGAAWIVNGGGRLWRVAADGSKGPDAIPTDWRGYVDIDHGIAPDGKRIAFTSGGLYRLPTEGGTPRPIVEAAGSYFHGWSPDGRSVLFAANRGGNLDVYAADAEGKGQPRRLTRDPGADDSASVSLDGKWVYFNSNRAGTFDLWRMPLDGDDGRAERLTTDDREDYYPHPSPDGKWLIFQSWPAGTRGRPTAEVALRRVALPAPGAKVGPGGLAVEELFRFVGGHGSLGNAPWAPDGRRLVYAAFDPPRPTARIVLISPNDLAPPLGAAERLDAIARAAERFLLGEMRARGYPAAVDRIFERGRDGRAEVITVRGGPPAADPRYQNPDWVLAEATGRARQEAGIVGDGHVFWVFAFVARPPGRYADWRGHGAPDAGGSAVVNYDSTPGTIDPEAPLEGGFNGRFFLKGAVHELGHALSLPHTGPDAALGLGNSLMGPNRDVYEPRKLPNPGRVYLADASAALLWKHPILSGTTRDRFHRPEGVRLAAFGATHDRAADRITLRGRVEARPLPHSVVVRDDLGRPDDAYWHISHAARVGPDGTFEVAVDRPTRADGHFHLLFAFPNGAVAADDARRDALGSWGIAKAYRFREGRYAFGDEPPPR